MGYARLGVLPLQWVWAIQRTRAVIKLVGLLCIYVLATIALTLVTTTAGPPLSVGQAVYTGLGFFVLNAPGTPVSGPLAAQGVLWFCAFAAPLLAGGFLVDQVATVTWRITGSPPLLLGFRDHAVVCGYGTHGEGVASWLVEAGYKVVIIDRKRRGDGQWMRIGAQGQHIAPVIMGDMADDRVLHLANAARASVVVFATSDGLENLRGAIELQRIMTERRSTQGAKLIVFVDERETFEYVVPALNREQRAEIIPISRGIVAEDLASQYPAEFDTQSRVAVVGLGRFGRALARRLESEGREMVVVDLEASARLEQAQLTSSPKHHNCDAVAWAKDTQSVMGCGAVFLCLDDDVQNLRVAQLLRKHEHDVVIVLRTLSPALKDLTDTRGRMRMVPTKRLVLDYLRRNAPRLKLL